MNISNQKNQTKNLVQDYIAWRLAKSGYHHWHRVNKIDLKDNTQNKLCTAMRHMAYKFEKVYEAEFSDELDITSFNCKDTFLALISELFEINVNKLNSSKRSKNNISNNNGIDSSNFNCNWGRVIGIFAFSGSLAIKCYEKQLTSVIYIICELQIEFLNNQKQIYDWIDSQGSWNTFLEYFNERYNLIKLENIDLPIENLNNTITRNNYFFKFHENASRSKIEPIFYLESIQNQCKSFFVKFSGYTGVAVGSIGVLALGAVYMKKK